MFKKKKKNKKKKTTTKNTTLPNKFQNQISKSLGEKNDTPKTQMYDRSLPPGLVQSFEAKFENLELPENCYRLLIETKIILMCDICQKVVNMSVCLDAIFVAKYMCLVKV